MNNAPPPKENLFNHPARTKLEIMSKCAPKGLWNAFEETRRRSSPALSQEYLGSKDALQTLIKLVGIENLADMERKTSTSQVLNAATTYLTLATWRISQGIYRFDPDVYSSLIASVISGDIPGDLLLRLPERCIFVETPGLNFIFTQGDQSPIHGVWTRIESIPGTGALALVMQPLLESVVKTDTFLHAFRIPASGQISLWDDLIIKNTLTMSNMQTDDGHNARGIRDNIALSRKWILPTLNLIIYICSENSEIGTGINRPHSTSPRATKKGARFFPADAPTKWDVATRLGVALRGVASREPSLASRLSSEVRPHIRRAHWHGVRVGPLKRDDGSLIPSDERKFELRWLPPIPVKVRCFDDLPATIRPIEASVIPTGR